MARTRIGTPDHLKSPLKRNLTMTKITTEEKESIKREIQSGRRELCK